MTASLVKLHKDIANTEDKLQKMGNFPHCERMTKDAMTRLQRMQIVHHRITCRFNRLFLFMGMDIPQARSQKVLHK